MKIIRPHLHRYRHLYALLVTAVAVLVAARYIFFPENFDWPAWVQAVGSIAAILVAVWVSADQALQQKLRDDAKERADIQGTLRSLRSEMEAALHYIDREVAPFLQESRPGLPLRVRFALPDYPFPIFDGLIPKLGALTNEQLHYRIIHTYAVAKSFVMTAQHHNQLLDDLDRMEDQVSRDNSLPNGMNVRRCGIHLTEYDDRMRADADKVRLEVSELVAALVRECPVL